MIGASRSMVGVATPSTAVMVAPRACTDIDQTR
jgi:hypothetical protein